MATLLAVTATILDIDTVLWNTKPWPHTPIIGVDEHTDLNDDETFTATAATADEARAIVKAHLLTVFTEAVNANTERGY